MVYANLEDIIDKYAKYVIQQARTNLTKDDKGGGSLYNSLGYELDVEIDAFLLQFQMDDYGVFVDKGVRGKDPTKLSPNARLTGQQAPNSPFRFGSGNYARFHTNNSNTYFDMNCGVVYWRQGSNTRFQNNMTNGTFTASGDVVAYGSPSDVRLKENIKPIESALDKVSRLQGVTFDWKQSDSILNIKEDVGFIAQDVQKVVPELVRENEDGMLSMRHQGIAPILLEAIKELKAEIEELKKCNKCNNCNCKTNNDGGTK